MPVRLSLELRFLTPSVRGGLCTVLRRPDADAAGRAGTGWREPRAHPGLLHPAVSCRGDLSLSVSRPPTLPAEQRK